MKCKVVVITNGRPTEVCSTDDVYTAAEIAEYYTGKLTVLEAKNIKYRAVGYDLLAGWHIIRYSVG